MSTGQDRAAPLTEAESLLRYLWNAELPIAAAIRAQQDVGDAMTVRDVFVHGIEGDPLVTDIDALLAAR